MSVSGRREPMPTRISAVSLLLRLHFQSTGFVRDYVVFFSKAVLTPFKPDVPYLRGCECHSKIVIGRETV